MINLPEGLTLPEGVKQENILSIQVNESEYNSSYQIVSTNPDGSIRQDAVVNIKRFN